ncbi:MAG: type I DNA topoisomerase [Candidatus Glassbacteria bacterium]|nr:type I DNA topoisomerase [Candidatus Glassbacteria bacterium]
MGKSLVIVESPAKAKTLSRYLGPGYEVKASVGHVIDLPEKSLGVDLEKDFKPTYKVIPGKGKVVQGLKQAARAADQVYLAPDPDREGEAIAWHIARILDKSDDKIHRVLFNEITRDAVLAAMSQPTRLNRNLFEAQQARRILDRLVGYQISPILWKVIRGGLSAGRVQSVAVRMVCEREEQIRAYQPKEYWSIIAELSRQDQEHFSARLWSVDSLRLTTQPDTEAGRDDRFWIRTADEAGKIVAELEKAEEFRVLQVERKKRRRSAPPPFITSTMQRDAAVGFGWTARKTMRVAQGLYEGVEIGKEGTVGLITYMRTDSTRLAETACSEARKFIAGQFGKNYLPDSPIHYRQKKGNVQDAHEAIRATSAFRLPADLKPFLDPDQFKLYRLIWARFIACQMNAALYDRTTVDIGAGPRFVFRASGSVMRFPGFTAVYTESYERNGQAPEGDSADKPLPDLSEGDPLEVHKLDPRQSFTQPPPRFTESSLIRELESDGIGRPSTYAAIMSTIIDKGYVERSKGVLKPTDLGFAVTGLLVERFPGILNVKFTARMESLLDEVEEGRQYWLDVLKGFYGDFKPALESAMARRQKLTVPTEVDCDRCGAKMVIRWSRHGQFLGCSNFPECTNTKQFQRDEKGDIRIINDEVSGERCARCGKPMVKKQGRYGPFLACSSYPECSGAKPLTTGVACPREGCTGELAHRTTRRGKVFYGCTRYPECDFATWDRPLDLACPECGARPLYEKTPRNRAAYVHCLSCKARLKGEDLQAPGGRDRPEDPEEATQSA